MLINNAAISGDFGWAGNSLDYLKRVYDVNVHEQLVMVRAASRPTIQQWSGRIVNVVSIAGYLHLSSGMAGSDKDDFVLSSNA